MPNRFAYHITKYFSEYLPLHIGAADNTCKSYRDAFLQLLRFIESEDRIRSDRIELGDISSDCVERFLLHLETLGISIPTRNHRLAAIHSFFSYLQKKELSCFEQCAGILSIPFKKSPSRPAAYLSVRETEILFSTPDPNNKRGLRELAAIALLYDAGARVQELIDLNLAGISLFSETPYVELKGKRGKHRKIPISQNVTAILLKYVEVFGIEDVKTPLFSNTQGKRLTRAGVQYILSKNISAAKEKEPSLFKERISNHSLRHSKAMHLVEAGVNLIYIRDFLGHSSIKTTETYAKANPELKRKILAENSDRIIQHGRFSKQKQQDLLDWLRDSF